ncbi:ribosome biogenesis GTPase Der [bacterium]|nr:MAG: ribosome biogenesis GTPase Der [bacterium]
MSLVAIVGRPNVGKSTLFNRLVGKKVAIVEDVPGVTRDRNYADAEMGGRKVTIVDTGGLEPYSDDELVGSMAYQVEQAVSEADLILFVVDAHTGPIPLDAEISEYLRKRARDVIVVVNKVDGPKQEATVSEFYSLGFTTVVPVSAEHNLGFFVLHEEMESRLPQGDEFGDGEDQAIRVAVLGRPNVGKSSFVNSILGAERVVVSPIAGTTRDAIDTRVVVKDAEYLLIDTAGIRRKSKVENGVERWSVLKALKAIERSEVCILMVDAIEGISDQDLKILDLILRGKRAAVLCLNKWDAVSKDHATFDHLKKDIAVKLGPMRHVPVISISALTGLRAERVFDIVKKVHEDFGRRISTSKLNDFMEAAMTELPPPMVGNKRTRIYYSTQVSTSPPAFAMFSSYPEGIPKHYERYLENRFRDTFGFEGVPLRLYFRKRKRSGEEEDDS